MFKPAIAIGLSPNTQNDDVWQAIKILSQPWKWRDGESLEKSANWFKEYFQVNDVTFFNSGRSALYAVLRSFGIGKGDEVLIQAFTCVAVPDPIIWVGARPVYIDIDKTLNIDPKLIEREINYKTKAIIVQHTFGIPAKIEMIKKIVQKHNLILIEDCAHSLGAEVHTGCVLHTPGVCKACKKIGTFGNAAIFSFGRDKVISSVFGGMAIVNSQPKAGRPVVEKLKQFHDKLPYPSYFWIFQQLLHPILFALILPLYNLVIGKVLLAFLLKMKFLSRPVYKEEFSGGKPDVFPEKYPNALAMLLVHQLNKLDYYNTVRKRIADYYFDKLKELKYISLPNEDRGAIYMRFNVLTLHASEIFKKAKDKSILLGNWYSNIVDPRGVDHETIGYNLNSCPKAEETARLSVNLPTYPRLESGDLQRVVDLIRRRDTGSS